MAATSKAVLIDGDVSVALRKLAAPMMLGIVFILAVNLADTYFVGQLGTAELAAMSFTFPVVSLVMSVAMGLGIGTTSAVSRALGAGDANAVRRLTTHALLLAVLVVAAISVLGVTTQRPLFAALGAEPALIPLIDDYMTIWYAGAVFLVVPMVANGVMRASGDAKTPMYIMMAAAVANLVLDPVLIFGLGPVPGLGLRGAAIATVIARSFTLLLSLYLLARAGMLDLRRAPRAELIDSWRQVLSVGMPAAVTNALVPVAAAVMTALVAAHGSAAVAGYGIGGRVEGLLLIAPMAVSSALTPFIGQNWGARQTARVGEALRLARRFALLWGAGVWLALIGAGGPIARAFTADPEAVAAARTYLWLVPLGYAAHGVVSVASAAFNAVDRAVRATLLSATRSLALAVPLAWIGSEVGGLTGMFGGIALATAIAGAIAALWLRRLSRPVVVGVEEAHRLEGMRAGRLRRVDAAIETAVDDLLDRVGSLEDITVRARPINTLGFYIGGHELGHVHRSGRLDLHLPPSVHDQLVREGVADHHDHIDDASWLSVHIASGRDVDSGAWLLGLGQAFGRLRADPTATADLDALEPSSELRRRVVEAASRCRARIAQAA